MTFFTVRRNGSPANADDLAPLAFAGHAHFTAMQVRDGRVRGLDLHLERLRAASKELYGQALPDSRILADLRAAIAAGPADVSLTATVYSPAGEFTADGDELGLDVLVRTGPPSSGPAGPLTLDVVEHERALPGIKHVGEVAKTHYLRQAVARGFDDAAFTDRAGRLSEATIWNLAFWDGTSVIWPEAEMLAGTMMNTIRRRLDVPQVVREVRPADLPGLSGAVVMNSWTPGIPVRAIGRVALPEAEEFVSLLHDAHRAEPLAAL